MNTDTDWLDFLVAEGAQLSPDGGVAGFGPAGAATQPDLRQTVLVPLVQLGTLRVSGDDASAFLQAQLTSDLDDVAAGSAGFSGYCTPKGRLLATPLLVPDGAGYLLIVPRALAAALAVRLARYVLRSRVGVEDVSSEFRLLGLVGPGAASALESGGGSAPRRLLESTRLPDALAVALPGERLLLASADQDARALWTRLAVVAVPGGQDAWELPGVRAGVANVLPQTQELFLPQMIDLERLGGVSFAKGCYPGQEIVARTHYLGEVKRRLCRGRSAATARAGDLIYAEDGGNEPVGVLANVARVPAGGVEFLAVMQREALNRPLRLGSTNGPVAELDAGAPLAAVPLEGGR
jgi:tRNA-modifying protein YgfZ